MRTLLLRQVSGAAPAQFQVLRLTDGTASEPGVVVSPAGFPVAGRPDSDLLRELRWYLEKFLDYPFPPQLEVAERVRESLEDWGTQAFLALFGSVKGRDLYRWATGSGLHEFQLRVSSDDPRVLAWPWEALRDPEADFFALQAQIERKLNQVADPPPLSDALPRDRVHILLVTARPYAADVGFRSISRPLVDLVHTADVPARVQVLRPPTFERLRAHLAERPHYYHIVHFDGHGGYGAAALGTPFSLRGARGQLVFETDEGQPDPIDADRLGALLREHQIPAVVLNACQSAMLDAQAEDPFASVAAALLKAGVRSVVAMAYSLYVSGAREFLPAFYTQLFRDRAMSRATRAGRQAMYARPKRVCARGHFPLQDWLVPVVYQHEEALEFLFSSESDASTQTQAVALPEEAQDTENPYGFIGRDAALLAIERALHRPPAGILIDGLGGVGKTTLARGVARWLQETEGLEAGCFWFGFDTIRSVDSVFNRIGSAFYGPDFGSHPAVERLQALVEVLRKHRTLLVFDNFESVRGIPGTTTRAQLSEDDQLRLRELLVKLRGGATKVLLTSRSPEEWLGPQNRVRLSLTGLQGEERWEYCETILRDLGKTVDRSNPQLQELMEALDGHPLLMRAVLPRLETESIASALAALRSGLGSAPDAADHTLAKVQTTLRWVEQGLPETLRPLLLPLGLHERFVHLEVLALMARQAEPVWTRERIQEGLNALVTAGLVHPRGGAVVELHPALTGYLRARPAPAPEPLERWTRAFVGTLGTLADAYTARPVHEQRPVFHLFGETFHHALHAAERLQMPVDEGALVQALAAFAQNTGEYREASRFFERLATWAQSSDRESVQAGAYHQLGIIAQEQRDFDSAQRWYHKSVEIEERMGNESGATGTYHQLGRIAEEQRDFDSAQRWYHKSVEINERLGNESGAAITYHQLGVIAQLQRDFDSAQRWYHKSLEINERLRNESAAATTYHQLGMIAEEQRDFDSAQRWYHKSLEIKERLGDESRAASTYHQLGILAQLQRDFDSAQRWYHKSLEITERLRNEHTAAITYAQLGLLESAGERIRESGRWLLRALGVFRKIGDAHLAERAEGQLLKLHESAEPDDQRALRILWQEAHLGPFPIPPDDKSST